MRSASGDPALLEQIVVPKNMRRARKQVKRNKGAPGVGGRTIDEPASLLREHRGEIKERLLNRTYLPHSVLRVKILRPDGGVRKLGFSSVFDGWIRRRFRSILWRQWKRWRTRRKRLIACRFGVIKIGCERRGTPPTRLPLTLHCREIKVFPSTGGFRENIGQG